MVNEKMRQLGARRSVIRELFEYGKLRRAIVGEDHVFDFTLGNPSTKPPREVDEGISELLRLPSTLLHGYTSAQGDTHARQFIASDIKKRFFFDADANLIYLTVGAAAALSIVFTSLVSKAEDEVIVPSPFFPEYKVFIEQAGARMKSVPCRIENFQLDLDAMEAAIGRNTQAVLLNSPNNPTGAVYPEKDIRRLCGILSEKEKLFGHPIYLIADEPYRELVYDGAEVPYLPCFYDNTIVCYSYSKSLSLPGERIGYILVSPRCADRTALFEAICGAGRALGYVCAPSLFQHLIPYCQGKTADISVYERNRNTLFTALTALGFYVAPAFGAFYLMIKAPSGDANAFCELAKKHEILLVPTDDFGCPGFVRLAYCVSEDAVKRSLPAFERLASDCKLIG